MSKRVEEGGARTCTSCSWAPSEAASCSRSRLACASRSATRACAWRQVVARTFARQLRSPLGLRDIAKVCRGAPWRRALRRPAPAWPSPRAWSWPRARPAAPTTTPRSGLRSASSASRAVRERRMERARSRERTCWRALSSSAVSALVLMSAAILAALAESASVTAALSRRVNDAFTSASCARISTPAFCSSAICRLSTSASCRSAAAAPRSPSSCEAFSAAS